MPAQVNFADGLNAQSAPHALPEAAVQQAVNIDFSQETGAATVRRGCQRIGTVGVSTPIRYITRIYNNANPDVGPWYVAGQNGNIYRGTWNTGTIAFSSIGSSTGSTGRVAIVPFQNKAYIAREELDRVDNGTNVYDWFLPIPTTPTISAVSSGGYNKEIFNGSYTVLDGTSTNLGTATSGGVVYNTITSGTGTQIIIEGTVTGTDVNYLGTYAYPDGATGTMTLYINPYGVDYTSIYLDNPSAVEGISCDLSYGGTAYNRGWHAATTPGALGAYTPDPTALGIAERESIPLYGPTQQIFDLSGVSPAKTAFSKGGAQKADTTFLGYAKTASVWARPRVGGYVPLSGSADGEVGAVGWDDIKRVRFVFSGTEPFTVIIGAVRTFGSEWNCLTDLNSGYRWYVSHAIVDTDGNTLAEGPLSDPTPAVSGQFLLPAIGLTSYTGNGVNKKFIYRSGGLLNGIYKVAEYSSASTSFIDYASPDMALLQNGVTAPDFRGVWGDGTWPEDVVSISEPFYSRLFFGYENRLAWSRPNQPATVPVLSETEVSHKDDFVQQLIVWDRLVIVNRDSVYEMDGSVFEDDPSNGLVADWTLKRSGSRRGSKAPLTCIKTPYGIPLLDYDGISMYVPSHGIDTPLQWVMEQVGDAWRGTADYNPAAIKGSRVPAINLSYTQDSCAAFAEDKLYLACPTGTATIPNTVFVLDFPRKKVDVFQYPFSIISMYWDFVANRLVAGTSDGAVMLLESTRNDQSSSAVNTPITWSVKTRAWSTPTDMVIENLSMEVTGGNGRVKAFAVLDNGTSTVDLGTYTNSLKQWAHVPLNGTVANNIVFGFEGTQSGSVQQGVWGMNWDAIQQPPRTRYHRTEETNAGTPGEKQWDVHNVEIEILGTGTVTCVDFIDTVATMTRTDLVGPTSGKKLFKKAYPMDTYGDIVYSTYTSTNTAVSFKFYSDSHETRPEPPRVVNFVSDREFHQNETRWLEHLASVNCLGTTVLATVFVDETALATHTLTGTGQTTYNFALPIESYGDTAFVKYVSQGGVFKHYKTWFNRQEEPDRVLNFVSPREFDQSEHWFKEINVVGNCFGGTVLATAFIEESAVGTYTLTGSGEKHYVFALPSATFGNVAYARLVGAAAFKHYRTWFTKETEPNRLLFSESDEAALPSETIFKTWLAELDPIGGTVLSTLLVDGVAVTTQTATGSLRKVFEWAVPTITSGKTIQAKYSSTTPFKHYKTEFESAPKPFGKPSWFIEYRKPGGATQLDLARFYSLDVEGVGIYTLTNTWEIDGSVFATSTHTATDRAWLDTLSFPPGGRGYLFQQKISSSASFKVWKANLDIERVGIKGLSRTTIVGRPNE